LETKRTRIIAIDGPAGSGKSTTARLVARKLGFTYLDTGALYRAVTWLALHKNIDLSDEDTIAEAARQAHFEIDSATDKTRVMVDGRDISEAIRMQEISNNVSVVASYPKVRQLMVSLQRKLAAHADVVVEGRDIGTVVFPDADIKIFLTASVEARTQRRMAELREKGVEISFEELKRDLIERDRKDSERASSPLRKADDAIELDTTELSIEQQVDAIVEAFQAQHVA